jgi:hypothetical protein
MLAWRRDLFAVPRNICYRERLQNLGWMDCQIIVEEQQCRLQP